MSSVLTSTKAPPELENGTVLTPTKGPPKLEDLPGVARPSLMGHLQIARVDHWFKNVFVFPGIVVAFGIDPTLISSGLPLRILIGLLAICLVASSNYVINEILDAPYDRQHPTKCKRPVPSGLVNIPLAYVQWIVLMLLGLGLALTVSVPFTGTLLVLWIMGCVYNIPPLRSKDLPYMDVLSEAVNNPIRMLAGWYIAGSVVFPPVSLLLSYWMVGSYFMAMKRFAEFRYIDNPIRAAAYRKSFAFYTEPRLLVSIMFYCAAAMLFFGSFLIRYRFELILAFPLVALVMAIYLGLAFKENSAVQRPEGLYREPALLAAVGGCTLCMGILMFTDIPILHQIFEPTIPLLK